MEQPSRRLRAAKWIFAASVLGVFIALAVVVARSGGVSEQEAPTLTPLPTEVKTPPPTVTPTVLQGVEPTLTPTPRPRPPATPIPTAAATPQAETDLHPFFIDPRFEWETWEMDGLRLHSYSLTEERVEEYMMAATFAIEAAKPLTGADFPDEPDIFVYENRVDMAGVAPPGSSGYYVAPDLIYINDGSDRKLSDGRTCSYCLSTAVLAHEMAHLVFGRATGWQGPLWLHEGFAEGIELDYLYGKAPDLQERYVADSRGLVAMHAQVFRVCDIADDYPEDPLQVEIFYWQSLGLVDLLLQSYDLQSFHWLLIHLAAGVSADVALSRAYGFGIEELEGQWRDHYIGAGIAWAPSNC